MASRTWMNKFPKRSVADMIGYCEYAMEEERAEHRPKKGGDSVRYRMAREMRLVLMEILARKRSRDDGRRIAC